MTSRSQPRNTSLFNNPTLSDVKIRQVYKGVTTEYFAHKAILCAHSRWFLKAFTGNFKEASEHTIEVLDDEPQNFEYMLKFLYTMEVAILPKRNVATREGKMDCDILAPIGIYVLADKYEIAPLLRRTLDLVETALITHCNLLNASTIRTIVTAYYTYCARPQSGMGVAMSTGLTYPSSWVLRGDIDKLALLFIAHGHFAADLFIARRHSSF